MSEIKNGREVQGPLDRKANAAERMCNDCEVWDDAREICADCGRCACCCLEYARTTGEPHEFRRER